jgi:hypothetical protein
VSLQRLRDAMNSVRNGLGDLRRGDEEGRRTTIEDAMGLVQYAFGASLEPVAQFTAEVSRYQQDAATNEFRTNQDDSYHMMQPDFMLRLLAPIQSDYLQLLRAARLSVAAQVKALVKMTQRAQKLIKEQSVRRMSDISSLLDPIEKLLEQGPPCGDCPDTNPGDVAQWNFYDGIVYPVRDMKQREEQRGSELARLAEDFKIPTEAVRQAMKKLETTLVQHESLDKKITAAVQEIFEFAPYAPSIQKSSFEKAQGKATQLIHQRYELDELGHHPGLLTQGVPGVL